MTKKRYVQVGLGSRSSMYLDSIMKDYKDIAEITAVCDSNMTRMTYTLEKAIERNEYDVDIKKYHCNDFEKMIEEQKPDVVIVTSMDRTHHKYICKAMELGCDVITEKPMTVDAEKCQQIVDVQKATGKKVTVTFNYRYSPRNTKIKELIKSGAIGDVTSVHFEWVLSTTHGADYFRRWHRDKLNSGGLLVHKSTHHFDLVNWWIDSEPETVFAMGRLAFYGRENAENRGVRNFYSRANDSEIAKDDPFAINLTDSDNLKGLYLDAEFEDGYQRDQSVFGYNINIEDNMSVLVRYKNKAQMSYSLNAHSPWEGYRVMFNGTKGRLEFNVKENSYVSGGNDDINLTLNRDEDAPVENTTPEIILQHHWSKPVEIKYEQSVGGHGGGDVRLLKDLFYGVEDNSLGHAAGIEDGVMSILTGIAANKSIATGLPVEVKTLVDL
ncbi:MAG: Gfo/Idh/MocA family oxidoreductase [Kiritimatiellae bacterium]|jgi:predicted dehydrogenase|nr:Gfo/Idh/MocA family oxidoreductase [Kiritimatiellia bacterium]